jgi:hypothetical protein
MQFMIFRGMSSFALNFADLHAITAILARDRAESSRISGTSPGARHSANATCRIRRARAGFVP